MEEIFRSTVLATLKCEGKIHDELIEKLMGWHRGGFSVYAGNRIARDDRDGQRALTEYIPRNAFSEQKITYIEETGKVLYRSSLTLGNNKKSFKLLTAEEFVAAITQHIPDKHFWMVTWYGRYSSRSRGARKGPTLQHQNVLDKIQNSCYPKTLKERFFITHPSAGGSQGRHESPEEYREDLLGRALIQEGKVMRRGALVCMWFALIIMFLAVPMTALCGSLDSPAPPASSASAMYTIDDIYNYLTTGITPNKRTGAFTEPSQGPPTSPTSSMHTLDDIMNYLNGKECK